MFDLMQDTFVVGHLTQSYHVETTATPTCVALGLYFHHVPSAVIGGIWSDRVLSPFLSAICRHLKSR